METAIDKIRKITEWAGWMNEMFCDRVRTLSDWEKLYDYCIENDVDFCDVEHCQDYADGEDLAQSINELMGYVLVVI